MDKIDYNILSLLQAEPELNITEIGKRVGLSHTPCWRRIKTNAGSRCNLFVAVWF